MNTHSLLLTVAATALLGTSAFAQTALDSSNAQTRIENLNEDIADGFDRSKSQFGNEGRPTGFDGSVALQFNATSGNTDTSSLGLGANMGYYDGVNGYGLQLSYQRSEDSGVVSDDSLLYELQYTRDLAPSLYGFAKLQGSIDELPFSTSDNFAGVGVGYRVIDTVPVQWTIEAGLGYRVADFGGVGDFDEGALSLSSSYDNQLSETVALTMDTDVIGSDSDTVFYNDLGLNVAMTETLAVRTSMVTEYHTDPAAGRKDTDNTFGVSLVYNFN